MAIPEALKFIEEYQQKKYGCIARGEAKALMFAQVLKAKDEKQIHALQYAFGKVLNAVSFAHHLEDGFEDHPCWVAQDGTQYYCGVGHHRFVAESIFFQEEKEFEKTHAKITATTKSIEEALKYVVKPSRMMENVVCDLIKGNPK